MKITKKELFKFCDDNNDAINELQSQSDNTDFLLAVLIQQLKDSGVIDEISPEPKPQLKQLDQSVFDGLDEKWRFAAVDEDSRAFAFNGETEVRNSVFGFSTELGGASDYLALGKGYDASNWQNSLIERDVAKELLEVDLSSELTGSDYFYSNITSSLLESGSKLVVCFVSNVSESDALDEKRIEVITSLDVEFNDTDDYGWHYAVPINNQGEPLNAAEVGL